MKLQSFADVALIGRVCLVFLGLGALSGCASIEVGLGLRMRLDKVPVTAISATLSPDPGLSRCRQHSRLNLDWRRVNPGDSS
jgi:hypothetical protein